MLLSMGTQALAAKGAIVKRLRSVETLGSTSAICSDKTGTLTLNQMTARQLVVAGRRYGVDGEGYSTDRPHLAGRRHGGAVGDQSLEDFMLPMALANDAVIRDGACIGDPTEGALVVLAAKSGLDVDETRNQHPRVGEVPFDAEYKLMATFHEIEGTVRCFVKGAPDVLLARIHDATATPTARTTRSRIWASAPSTENDRIASEGMRVLAVARRDFDPKTFDPDGDLLALVNELEFLALIGIVDPPRKEAKDAIAEVQGRGHPRAHDHRRPRDDRCGDRGELGIEGRAMTGAEFAAMPDEQLLGELESIGVVARVAPEDKVRLVSLLKEQGNIVAMTGDGVNDAPALTRADIGVAMGITGTEVTKDAAEMILTDDNFATIVEAVEGGRGLYDNLMKYIRVQMIMLAGFILTFLGASIFNIANGAPLAPLQILWVNFAVDVVLAFGLGFDAPTPGLMKRKPRSPDRSGHREGTRCTARVCRPAHLDRRADRRVMGREPLRPPRRDDDGLHDHGPHAHRRLARMARPLPLDLQPGHDRERTLQLDGAPRARLHVHGHDDQRPGAHPRDGRPHWCAVAGLLHRRARLPRPRGAREGPLPRGRA